MKFKNLIFICLFAGIQATAQQSSFKFDFGVFRPIRGYSAVTSEVKYDENGSTYYDGNRRFDYGLEFSDSVSEMYPYLEDGSYRLKKSVFDDCITADKPFYFSVRLPEGNYNVKVMLSNRVGNSETTIKAECRRLMVEKITMAKNEFKTVEFTVHVKDSIIKGTKNKVRLKSREINYLHWDNKLTLEFSGKSPEICAIEITPAKQATTVFLAGNSTVVDQAEEPWAAWGQMIPAFFQAKKICIANYAESGETLKAFKGERRLEKIWSMAKPGDYLFIEFAHNDQKPGSSHLDPFTTYKSTLKEWIDEAKKRQMIPVLVTSMHRRSFDSTGHVINTLLDYPEAMQQTAKEENVALIDLNAMSKIMYEAWGPEKSIKAFVHFPAHTFPNQDSALKDNTHFTDYGAYELAKCVVNGIKRNIPALAKYLKENLPAFDPAHPDPFEKWDLPMSSFITAKRPDGDGQLTAVMPVDTATISIDFTKPVGDMKPIWAWFGYDEPNYTYMKDGKKLLSELAALSPVPVFVRTHNLLTTGDGTPSLKWGSTNAYTEDSNGKPVYNWRIIDSIFDTYIQRGMKPLAQIGFMPEALSTNPVPYKHSWRPGASYKEVFTGWSYPPNDYNKWRELVYQWVKHCVARYGKREVESWYWEVWNEPNIPYWNGTLPEYLKLYDYAADGVRKALPTAKIGGCDATGGGSKFIAAFIQHCLGDTNYATGKIGSPLDLVLFHAKGQPRVVDGRVVMNVGTQMRNIRDAFATVNTFPSIKNIPLVIGESDPEGCAACGMNTNPENAYRNGTMYSSYTAASFARKYLLADSLGVNLMGAVSWSFEFENQPWFAGFRDLATNGVDKPVLNVFRMFGMMKGKRVQVTSDHMYDLTTFVDSSVRGQTDIGAIAAIDKNSATIMVWNYHDEDIQGNAAKVYIALEGLPSVPKKIMQFRIDNNHSNSYEAWKKMGSPQNPTAAQVKELEKAGELQSIFTERLMQGGAGSSPLLSLSLPRQGVSFFVLSF